MPKSPDCICSGCSFSWQPTLCTNSARASLVILYLHVYRTVWYQRLQLPLLCESEHDWHWQRPGWR